MSDSYSLTRQASLTRVSSPLLGKDTQGACVARITPMPTRSARRKKGTNASCASPLAGELSETFQMLGRMHVPTADGVGDVTNVQIAARVNGDTVRGNKLRRPLAFFRLANAGLQLPMQIVDTDPMPEARCVVNPTHAIQFANKEVALMV
jgi:hypothetical protein